MDNILKESGLVIEKVKGSTDRLGFSEFNVISPSLEKLKKLLDFFVKKEDLTEETSNKFFESCAKLRD